MHSRFPWLFNNPLAGPSDLPGGVMWIFILELAKAPFFLLLLPYLWCLRVMVTAFSNLISKLYVGYREMSYGILECHTYSSKTPLYIHNPDSHGNHECFPPPVKQLLYLLVDSLACGALCEPGRLQFQVPLICSLTEAFLYWALGFLTLRSLKLQGWDTCILQVDHWEWW